MKRLTDEENPYPDEPREQMRGGVHTAFNAGAKAQLKKVVEWGNELCDMHGKPMFKHQCSKCWQALLEEVKE